MRKGTTNDLLGNALPQNNANTVNKDLSAAAACTPILSERWVESEMADVSLSDDEASLAIGSSRVDTQEN